MEEKKYIITVGRQYGCGGRELAEILAEKLGVHLYDRQIVHLAAAKLGINDLSEKDLLELENTVKPLSSRFIPFHSFGMAMGEFREERGRTAYEGKSLKELNRENEKRARYYDYYTGRKWGDSINYDLVVKTGRAPLAQIADGIIAYMHAVKG